MSKRKKKIERIMEQETPSINEVLDAGIKHGLAPLAEELRDPTTPLHVKIAILKAFTHIQKHIFFVDHEVAVELREQVEAEVAALEARVTTLRAEVTGLRRRASIIIGAYQLICSDILPGAAIRLATKGDSELAEQVTPEIAARLIAQLGQLVFPGRKLNGPMTHLTSLARLFIQSLETTNEKWAV